MAAEQAKSGNEWTAGLIAIFATILIGGAIPVALYFAMYVPQTKKKLQQEQRLAQLQTDYDLEFARTERIGGLKKDGEQVEKELKKVEERFADKGVQSVLDKLQKLLDSNKLDMTPDAKTRREASAIRVSDLKSDFPGGLQAVPVTVNCWGTWKDFATFIAAVESMGNATVVVGELRAAGDKNAGKSHTYEVELWIVQRRDTDAIGR